MRIAICTAIVTVALAACATAPRGPAGTLADAGLRSTAVFSTEVRDLSKRLVRGDVADAFARTWELCQVKDPKLCKAKIASGEVSEERRKLAAVVNLRANAIEALHRAYASLKTEADYDARADLVSAVDQSISSVNAYASSIASIAGAAPGIAQISKPLTAAATFGAGLIAERRQTKRLHIANVQIGAAAKRLRDTLVVEAWIFDSISKNVVDERITAQIAMLHSGLTSRSVPVGLVADDLGVTVAKDADSILAKSVPARAAVEAALRASAWSEARALNERYQVAIAALTSLVAMHEEFAIGRPLNLNDVNRFLDELGAALNAAKS